MIDKIDFLAFKDPQSQEKNIVPTVIFGRKIRIRRENLKKIKGKKVSDVKLFENIEKIENFQTEFFLALKFFYEFFLF